MKTELKNDLIATYNEIIQALTILTNATDQPEFAPLMRLRLDNAKYWLGKYVTANDTLKDL
jgi:hypothetical protein